MSTQLIELQELAVLVSILNDLTKGDNTSYKNDLAGSAIAIKLLDSMIGTKAQRLARMNGVE